jgi:glycosyltransferase involved in cell wall biosynthesis
LASKALNRQNALEYSIIIPAKNECMTIGIIIDDVKKIFAPLNGASEIIVIDDGSSDQTFDIACKAEVRVIRNSKSLGKGYALRQGFSIAQGEVIVTLDADGSHMPKDIPALLSPILKQQADMVIGVRDNKSDISFIHHFGNKMLNAIISIMTLQRYRDTQCGFRTFRREVLDKIKLKAINFEIESEMLLKTSKEGFKVVERDITYVPRSYGISNINVIRDGLRIFYRIFDTIVQNILH